jgi:hypothetical protein
LVGSRIDALIDKVINTAACRFPIRLLHRLPPGLAASLAPPP